MFIARLAQENPILLVVLFASLVIGITVHEFAHAFAAYKSGDNTSKYMGRLTLNPIAHLDPMGSLFFLLVGFGWGKPVPVNPNNYHKSSDEIKVSLAGIVANLLMALILAIPIRYALLTGQNPDASLLLVALNYAIEVNLLLAAFNLLPIYPLDGSHIISYFLDDEAKEAYQSAGLPLLFGLVLLAQITGISVISTVIEPIMRVFSFIVRGTFGL
ncbi:MAG: Peptidase family M50 [bacterium ADurb.Bin400]|nr:MAG: Peptidase family M50 [bacterium ADurb.Bin400]